MVLIRPTNLFSMNPFIFQAARPIETSRHKGRQTKANYVYRLQLTTTHKFRQYEDKKLKLKTHKKTKKTKKE